MDSNNDIGIVGFGIHCPGARSADQFWRNLRDGIESVTFLTDEELLTAGLTEHELANPNYVKAGAFLDGVAEFDAEFFGLSPKEAAIMDPQHRHFLEVCWEALEHAGHPPGKFQGPIGVFGGCGMGTYMMYNLITNLELMESVGYFSVRHTGNDKDFLTTRVSYALNLQGPSVNVQTACSTSLVAAHMASQSLLMGECDLALAGGVTIEIPHRRGYVYREREILSPDGHCRAFDHRAQGTIFGSGAAVVVLRRLNDAIRDDDQIYAVIKGSAINNDGSMKVGYLAPSVEGQSRAIAEAIAVAGVSAESIGYVEAHGTGTPVGDPIEVSALTQAYRATTDAKGFCGIGSVKTNIGHLDTAAGVVGLIKAALALRHRQIPPSLNWEAPNPTIDFANSPFYVNCRLRDWPKGDTPRRAAVNSLGVGGTNAHMILEEPPEMSSSARTSGPVGDRPFVLRLSARNPMVLDENARRLAAFLREHPATSLADVEMTLRTGRQDFQSRRVLACRSNDEAIELLEGNDRYRVFTHTAGPASAVPIFLFPGGGTQHVGMAAGLYRSEKVFRDAMDRCLEIARRQRGIELEPILFSAFNEASVAQELERPSRQLPAIFAVEFVLSELWASWNVKPQALLGHSMGENTAACVAGVLTPEDAMGLVCLRGELFETLSEGSMIGVSASAEEVSPLLSQDVVIALKNAPELCVVSGPVAAIERVSKELAKRGIDATRVPIKIAAHSPLLEPILEKFRSYLKGLRLRPPKIPFLSNRTGTWITSAQATDPEYWVNHLRGTVYFSDCLDTLLRKWSTSVLIEVGPGTTLSSLVRLQPGFQEGHNIITSLRHRDQEVADTDMFLTAVGRVWASGLSFDESKLGATGRRIVLPTYAFQHRPYWIEPCKAPPQHSTVSPLPCRVRDWEEWYHAPRWEPCRLPVNDRMTTSSWLLFLDELGVGEALAEKLRSAGHSVVIVRSGPRNAKISDTEYWVDSDRGAEGYVSLVQGLDQDQRLPDRVLHLWMLTGIEAFRTDLNRFTHNMERSFYSLFFLLRALSENDTLADIHVIAVSNGARRVANEPVPDPEKVTHDGPCRVATREFENVTCKSIDIDIKESTSAGRWQRKSTRVAELNERIRQLHEEILEPPRNVTLAYRDGERFELRYAKVSPPAVGDHVRGVCVGGTYLITGGLGGVGLTIAESIAEQASVNLLLIGRSSLPPREEWTNWIRQHSEGKVTRAIRAVHRLESLGATVECAAVDVTDQEELTAFVRSAESRYGPIRGVVHAAGVINDSLIAVKTVEEVENVFAPKVYGTMVLDMVLRRQPLDFFILFSSTSTVTAPPGQVDYVAANAFLNAFAQSCSDRQHQRVTAINWGVWKEVGMAAEATHHTEASSTPAKHPLFREIRDTTEGKQLSLVPLSTTSHWLLDEHRLADGGPIVPGTAMIEIAADALAEVDSGDGCEIRNLQFLSPLAVGDGQVKRVRAKLQGRDHHFEFELQSLHRATDGRYGWLTHAQAHLTAVAPRLRPVAELSRLRARCRVRKRESGRGDLLHIGQGSHVHFGPRWQVLREIHYGDGEALADLELPPQFQADLSHFRVHPALLDMATGCAMELIEGYDAGRSVFWVPKSYERIVIHQALPSRIVSWIRNHRPNDANQDTASFDVLIFDESGVPLVEVDGFTIQKIPRGDLLASLERIPLAAMEADRAGASAGTWNADLDPITRALHYHVSQGILAEEGMSAFNAVVNGCTGPEIIISSLDLNSLRDQSEKLVATRDANKLLFERPSLDNEFVAPSSDVERKLVEYWQELLGIEAVGVHDSFFDLGGHSLVAVRLFAKIKSTWDVSLPVGTLLEAPTIQRLARLIPVVRGHRSAAPAADASRGGANKSQDWTSLVTIRKTGSLPPLFCVAGKGGNPMNLRHLAARLGDHQPFYGIQHRGVDGVLSPHTSVEEMALACIRDVRRVQPKGPYLLSGFSAGGLVAYEMARSLHDSGDEVALLALLDTWDPALAKIGRMNTWANHLRLLKGRGLAYLFERLERRCGRLLAGRHGVTRSRKTLVSADQAISVQESAVQAWRFMEAKYVAQPCNVKGILFRPYRSSTDIDWTSLRVGNESNGWDKYLLGGVEVLEVPGGHATMCEEPHVRILARRLTQAIAHGLTSRETADCSVD